MTGPSIGNRIGILAGIVLVCAALAACGGESGDDATSEGGKAAVSVEEVEAGRKLYEGNGCAVCHGDDGKGDGWMSRTLTPRPRDLRDPSGYKRGASVAEIAGTLKVGLMVRGKGMPGYPHMSERDRRSIAAYVVSLHRVVVRDAWVRERIPSRDVTAAYMTIENPSVSDATLLSVKADAARTVELHRMELAGEMMKMVRVDRIDVPAGGTVELKPGGLHLMLIGLTGELKPGDRVRIVLEFEGAVRETVMAPVRRLDATHMH